MEPKPTVPIISGAASPRLPSPETAVEAARLLGCAPEIVRAVAEVESAGAAFDGQGRLIIRPEPHILWRRLRHQDDRQRAEALGLTRGSNAFSWPDDPSTYWQRWEWMQRCADAFGLEMACQCTSAGLMQIMGFNHAACGYANAEQMFRDFAEGADRHIIAAARFFQDNGKAYLLRTFDYEGIATFWNGPAGVARGYHIKLREAHERQLGGPAALPAAASSTLREGMRGTDVKALQKRLSALGFQTLPDGMFGGETLDQVLAFQRREGLRMDGVVGPETRAALDTAEPKAQAQVSLGQVITASPKAQATATATVLSGVMAGAATMDGLASQLALGVWGKIPTIAFREAMWLLALGMVALLIMTLVGEKRAARARKWWGA